MIHFKEIIDYKRVHVQNKSTIDKTRMYKCYKLLEKQYDSNKNLKNIHI